MWFVWGILVLMAAATSLPADPLPNLPEPGELALVLNEDEFEDYLDTWLYYEEQKHFSNTSEKDLNTRSGCALRVNGDLGQPQPVFLHNNHYMRPNGNSGIINLGSGEQVTIACTGTGRTISHPNLSANLQVGVATCVNNALVSAWWLNGHSQFGGLTCSNHAYHDAVATGSYCWNNNIVIRVGFIVSGMFYPLYYSCFDPRRLEVIYVWYQQTPENAVHQTGVDRPSFLAGSFFPGVAINTVYTQVQQKAAIAQLVGQDLADKYVTNTQFLARGHLAAKTDFVFATGQRASFYFINAAPQWQPFNGGNWNWLEQTLRQRIGQAGYNTLIYTGTFGVTQLRDQNNRLVDIFLHRDANNNPQVPVPLYFYKVVYDADRRLGTAFISINNPYYTLAEVQSLTFCTDRCRNNGAFSWLTWLPDRIDLGYSFCCDVDEFRRTVPHLPSFTVNGLLT